MWLEVVGDEMHSHSMPLGEPFCTASNSRLPVRRGRHRHLNERPSFRNEVGLAVTPDAEGEAYEGQGEMQPLHSAIVCDAANVRNGWKAGIRRGDVCYAQKPLILGLQFAGANDDHIRIITDRIKLSSNRSDDCGQVLSDDLCPLTGGHLDGGVGRQTKVILDRFSRNANCSLLPAQLDIQVRQFPIWTNLRRTLLRASAHAQTSQRTSIMAVSMATAIQVAASSLIGVSNPPVEPVFCWFTSRPFPPRKFTRKA